MAVLEAVSTPCTACGGSGVEGIAQTLVKAAPVPESRACAYSKPREPVGCLAPFGRLFGGSANRYAVNALP